MTSPDHQAAAASPGPPTASGEARPADRLDLLREHIRDARGLTTVDAVNLVNLARAYRDCDDRVALELRRAARRRVGKRTRQLHPRRAAPARLHPDDRREPP